MLDKIFKFIERFFPVKYRWILNHDGFKRYFANTGWMFFGQMFSLVFSFFIGAWVARYLGPENYGAFSYAIAFAGIFGFVSSLGVDGILSRDLVAYPEKRDDLLGTAFRLKLLGGLIAFLAAGITVFLFDNSSLIRILVLLYSLVFILQAVNVISIFFQADVQAKKNIRATLTATFISSILKIILILFNQGIIWFMVVGVFDVVWQGLGFMSAYKRSGLKIKTWHFDRTLAKKILSASWFLMLASASYYIYIRIDQVMIGMFLGEKEVGLYAAAVKFVEIWSFIPGIICASLFPAIINAKKTDTLIYKKRLKALYLLMTGVAIIIAILTTVLAPWAIILLFGSQYLGAIIILQIYVWSGLGLSIGWVITQYFLSENRSRDIFLYNLLSMLANVVLNLILIPRLGLTGAAWATLISYSVGPVVMAIIWWLGNLKKKELLSSV